MLKSIDLLFVWVVEIGFVFGVRAEHDLLCLGLGFKNDSVFVRAVEIDLIFVRGSKKFTLSCAGSKWAWFLCRWSKLT